MVNGEIKGNKLILTVDIGDDAIAAAHPSETGKKLVVASTGGFTGFGPVKANVVVTVPNPAYVKAR